MEGYEASTYGDRFADVYDQWYAGVSDVAACTAALAALAARAGGGPVLELGVGSGRLAVPLAERGVDVFGVDASTAMLERLRARPGGDRVRAWEGDMTEPPGVEGGYAVVFVAFNTFFNLPTLEVQQRCLEGVASVLAPAGRFVLEGFVPADEGRTGQERRVEPRHITADEVVVTATIVDHDAQTVTGSHVHFREDGTRLRPWYLRWATPAQLDAMAEAAGLVLEARHGGWSGEPFTEASGVHVSTYRLLGPR